MTKLWHHFQEGGWVMYPIFAFGLIAVGAAARFALRGEHQLLAFVRWTTATLLLTGLFGFTVGMMTALHATERTTDPEFMARIVLTGSAEAANLPASALMFSIIASLCVAIGQRRFPLPNPSAVAR
jgi:hypothetical protein